MLIERETSVLHFREPIVNDDWMVSEETPDLPPPPRDPIWQMVPGLVIGLPLVIPYSVYHLVRYGPPWVFHRIKRPRLSIIVLDKWSRTKRLTVSFGIFAGLWTLLEPIVTLTTGVQFLTNLNWLAYLSLVILSVVAMAAAEFYALRRQLGSADLLTFTIEFVKTGRHLEVRVPRDMEISTFLDRLAVELEDIYPPDLSLFHLYENNLLLRKRNGKYRVLPSIQTFREAGVSDGSVCRIRGYIRLEYFVFRASHTFARWRFEFDEYRERYGVVLDELDSITFERAVSDRLLTEPAMNAAARKLDHIERGVAQSLVGTFVVRCPDQDIDEGGLLP